MWEPLVYLTRKRHWCLHEHNDNKETLEKVALFSKVSLLSLVQLHCSPEAAYSDVWDQMHPVAVPRLEEAAHVAPATD